MRLVTYISDAVKPGGTPARYLVWVSVVLICQVLGSVLPYKGFYESMNLSHWILSITLCLAIAANFFKTDKQRIGAAFALYIVGLLVSTITISYGITSLSGIVFMLTWAMTLFVAERREYISFDLVTVFMVLMLISSVILLMNSPSVDVTDNMIILAVGAIITAINIYLVYADFGKDRNYYQESRKTYENLEILSSKLSDILGADGKLKDLLWEVSEECVPFLGLEECVIYLYNEEHEALEQIAAFGDKSKEGKQIHNPIMIKSGQGIVGEAFATARYVLVQETKKHANYIVDDAERNSELAVPIMSQGRPIGVIDSEHTLKGFFRERHVQAFQIIASFCGIKITEVKARESITQAAKDREEAERYKELDELKNRFITNISHDLKTPLSLIKGPATQIHKEATGERLKQQASYVLKNTEHLLRVVNQLLQLNRVDLGLNELYMEKVILAELFSKVEGQYRGLAEKEQISFVVESDNIVMATDSFRLEQIIHNLVHNAFRYSNHMGNG